MVVFVVGGFEGELCKHVGFEGESCDNVFVCVSLVSSVSCVLVDLCMRCVWMLVFSVKLVFWGLVLNVEFVVVVLGCDLWYFLVGEQCLIEFRFWV